MQLSSESFTSMEPGVYIWCHFGPSPACNAAGRWLLVCRAPFTGAMPSKKRPAAALEAEPEVAEPEVPVEAQHDVPVEAQPVHQPDAVVPAPVIKKEPDETEVKPKLTRTDERLATIDLGQPMGKLAAQAIIDRLKSISKKDPQHQGLQIYRQLQTDAQRRSFGVKLALDKEGSFCKAVEKQGFKQSDTDRQEHGRLALWEIAHLEKLPWKPDDNEVMALLQAFVVGLPEFPHPVPALANAGWKVYEYTKKLSTVSEQCRYKELGVEGEKALEDNSEWKQGLEQIDNASASASSAAQPRPAIKDKSKLKELKEENRRKRQEKEDARLQKLSPEQKLQEEAKKAKVAWLREGAAVLKAMGEASAQAKVMQGKLERLRRSGALKFFNRKLETEVAKCIGDMQMSVDTFTMEFGAVEEMRASVFMEAQKRWNDAVTVVKTTLAQWGSKGVEDSLCFKVDKVLALAMK